MSFLFHRKEIITPSPDQHFADIHCHMLPGVDDGAADEQEMRDMMDMAYAAGTRLIAFTPHIREPWLRRPDADLTTAYAIAQEYAAQLNARHADRIADGRDLPLRLSLGCELYYNVDAFDTCSDSIRPYTGTDYLLTEFSPHVSYMDLVRSLQDLMSRGYSPVLAHIERYACLWMDGSTGRYRRELDRIYEVRDLGVLLQMNCDTIAALTDSHAHTSAVVPTDRTFRKYVDSLLRDEMISFLSTDAHDTHHRQPVMTQAYTYVATLCGADYAGRVTYDNAGRILNGEYL